MYSGDGVYSHIITCDTIETTVLGWLYVWQRYIVIKQILIRKVSAFFNAQNKENTLILGARKEVVCMATSSYRDTFP